MRTIAQVAGTLLLVTFLCLTAPVWAVVIVLDNMLATGILSGPRRQPAEPEVRAALTTQVVSVECKPLLPAAPPPDPATLDWSTLEGRFSTPKRRRLAKLAYDTRRNDPEHMGPPNYDEFLCHDPALIDSDTMTMDEVFLYKSLHDGWWYPGYPGPRETSPEGDGLPF